MIAVLGAAATVAVAPAAVAFAPPIGLSIPYRSVVTRPDPHGGTIRMSVDERLRFDMGVDGLEATLTGEAATVDAPPASRSYLLALMAGTDGSRLRARLDDKGQVAAIVDGAASWEATRASHAAALARLDADPACSAEDKRRAHIVTARLMDVGPDVRDARLTDVFADLLPPIVPALPPNGSRRFAATLAGPTGPMAATGTVTLVATDPRWLRFRIETRTDRQVDRRAADALLAATAPAATPDAKDQRAADTDALRELDYDETLDATVERSTGLLIRSRLVRRTSDARGLETVVDDMTITRLVDKVF